MSPLPVRDEMNASCRPSGEYSGRASFAGCETSNDATPPAAGTVQISPPETNAISLRSGESDGSVKYGRGSARAVVTLPTIKTTTNNNFNMSGASEKNSVLNPRSQTHEQEMYQTLAPSPAQRRT